MREAIDLAPPELASGLRAELEVFRGRSPSQANMEAARQRPRSASSAPPPAPPAAGPDGDDEPPRAPAREAPATTEGKVAKAKASLDRGARDAAEALLTEALCEGSLDAADMLDALLKDDTARSDALLNVRRQAVDLNPGSAARLVALRDAARADQNPKYVRAIEHVLHAFDEVAEPPPLSVQDGQPGMFALLTRHSYEPAGEAFGVVWDGAPALFARSPAAAGMTGLERVVPGPTSALSRVYEVALRLLDTPRFTLYCARGAGVGKPAEEHPADGAPLSASVALLSPPAAVLSGDLRDDGTELRWALGQALSCVLPQNALVLGLELEEARSLWSVLLGAFGPPGLVAVDRKDAELAEILWQTLAPRAQRRLKELLASSDVTSFELVLERARQSGRRVGMFLSGDFGRAARAVLADFPHADAGDLERPGGLERLCAELPSLADLLRLAVRPEYADARWHLPTPAARRLASGRLPPV